MFQEARLGAIVGKSGIFKNYINIMRRQRFIGLCNSVDVG